MGGDNRFEYPTFVDAREPVQDLGVFTLLVMHVHHDLATDVSRPCGGCWCCRDAIADTGYLDEQLESIWTAIEQLSAQRSNHVVTSIVGVA